MTTNIFTYGSLMFPEVWQRVVRGTYESAQADLLGYVRLVIVGETYPGMIARPGRRVRGVLYFAVTAEDEARLDDFEGDEYRRVPVTVSLANGELCAETYVFEARQRCSEVEWRPESFQMQRFMETYCRDKLGEEDTNQPPLKR